MGESNLSADERMTQCDQILKPFRLTQDDYNTICESIRRAMDVGLACSDKQTCSLKMLPSFVTKIPCGSVTMNGIKEEVEISEKTYSIPPKLMSGSGHELFAYIATTVKDFVRGHNIDNQRVEMGVMFAFPCEQRELKVGILITWTKGFDLEGIIGEDVIAVLQKELDNVKCNVHCKALVNDTVATLAASAFHDNRTTIGLIVDLGTNAAYIEKTARITALEKKLDDSHMIINTEWGAFGKNGELESFRTAIDRTLDGQSLRPGEQLFEKLASALYLGEIVRLILIELIDKHVLFRGIVPEKLTRQNGFSIKSLIDVERDPDNVYSSTHNLLTNKFKISVIDSVDVKIVRKVCETIALRGANLIGTGIAAILRQMQEPDVTIGIEGSLYRFHPKISDRLNLIIDRLKPPNTKFHTRTSIDGSGLGAAAITAAAIHQSKPQ